MSTLHGERPVAAMWARQMGICKGNEIMKTLSSILTIGSKSLSRQFEDVAATRGLKVINLSECSDSTGSLKNVDVLMEEIVQVFERGTPRAVIVFGRSSSIGGIPRIAEAWCKVCAAIAVPSSVLYIGPSPEGAAVLNDKTRTYAELSKLGWTIPEHYPIGEMTDGEIAEVKFPIVVKATNLTGGCGQILVGNLVETRNALEKLRSIGLTDLFAMEFLDGVEVSYSIVRLGTECIPMPVCYRGPTSLDLRHPDSKIKLTGVFPPDPNIYEKLNQLATRFCVQGPLGIEGVLVNTKTGLTFVVLESCTRLSGSTPIRLGSLKTWSLFEAMTSFVMNIDYTHDLNLRPGVQFPIEYSGEAESLLSQKPWLLGSKVEDLSQLPYSMKSGKRIRVSFCADSMGELYERAEQLSRISRNQECSKDMRVLVLELEKRLRPYFDSLANY
jgi:hypothetical protein